MNDISYLDWFWALIGPIVIAAIVCSVGGWKSGLMLIGVYLFLGMEFWFFLRNQYEMMVLLPLVIYSVSISIDFYATKKKIEVLENKIGILNKQLYSIQIECEDYDLKEESAEELKSTIILMAKEYDVPTKRSKSGPPDLI